MIVDQTFIDKFKTFPLDKSHVWYEGVKYRTYREQFKDRSKRELCIAISLETKETYVSFNIFHTRKTTRLKVTEGSADRAIDFIKGFEFESTKVDEPPKDKLVKNVKKRRFFKFL